MCLLVPTLFLLSGNVDLHLVNYDKCTNHPNLYSSTSHKLWKRTHIPVFFHCFHRKDKHQPSLVNNERFLNFETQYLKQKKCGRGGMLLLSLSTSLYNISGDFSQQEFGIISVLRKPWLYFYSFISKEVKMLCKSNKMIRKEVQVMNGVYRNSVLDLNYGRITATLIFFFKYLTRISKRYQQRRATNSRKSPIIGYLRFSTCCHTLMTPELYAAIAMTFSMACHWFGYEFSRAGFLGLFTSNKTGFPSSAAFPAAMTCATPFSALLLIWYEKQLKKYGPRVTLKNSTLLCALFILFSSSLICLFNSFHSTTIITTITIFLGRDRAKNLFQIIDPVKFIVWISFIFQNSYATFLCTQHWSFIGSILTTSQSAMYFSLIAGLSSISSTLAGVVSSVIVKRIQLTGLLTVASLSLFVSLILGDVAYYISNQKRFNPSLELHLKKHENKKSRGMNLESKKMRTLEKYLHLFKRVPILGALFLEVISFQTFSTILNILFVTKLCDIIKIDSLRARWTANFYAVVNGFSALLQFAILPLFMAKLEPMLVWRFMPVILLTCTLIQGVQVNPSLHMISFSVCILKTLDYSLRQVLSQMIFVSLDFESRYLGKEIIGIVGNRLGKMGISIVISIIQFMFGTISIRQLTSLTVSTTLVWSICVYRLSCLVSARYSSDKKEPQKIVH